MNRSTHRSPRGLLKGLLLSGAAGVVCLAAMAQFDHLLGNNDKEAGPLDRTLGASQARPQDSPGASELAARPDSRERRINLGEARPDSLYAVTVWVKDPAQVQGKDAVHVTLADGSGTVAEKWLH